MILLFVGDLYYPSGGAEDLHSAHDTLEAALETLRRIPGLPISCWANTLDPVSGEITRWERDDDHEGWTPNEWGYPRWGSGLILRPGIQP